jgi:hypothetical protein
MQASMCKLTRLHLSLICIIVVTFNLMQIRERISLASAREKRETQEES